MAPIADALFARTGTRTHARTRPTRAAGWSRGAPRRAAPRGAGRPSATPPRDAIAARRRLMTRMADGPSAPAAAGHRSGAATRGTARPWPARSSDRRPPRARSAGSMASHATGASNSVLSRRRSGTSARAAPAGVGRVDVETPAIGRRQVEREDVGVRVGAMTRDVRDRVVDRAADGRSDRGRVVVPVGVRGVGNAIGADDGRLRPSPVGRGNRLRMIGSPGSTVSCSVSPRPMCVWPQPRRRSRSRRGAAVIIGRLRKRAGGLPEVYSIRSSSPSCDLKVMNVV